ncbi:LPS-assembly protein LptD [Phycisphaera mikurensis]|uniref:LptD C-terminal domain-containing protein n=1 Tax=Phycisphaera mikurensis (strain NBRC 102666 / KCTC 22515 / FYK2301M01) TaxID=1142394 RepID=I0IHV3_PHYMF|nr:hypothetical protein [Phycisphaera mikurensis]MBB6441082.1 hypothetical protein [Phycisphaera mikurensis]BAM04841.1 hypothetical protein PSMK_26820 [Phycisphaera mikurensis NBRC 102666]
MWETPGGVRYVLLRGLPVRADAAAAGAGGGARLTIGRRVFEAREALVELTPAPGGYALRAALADARGRSRGGGSVGSARPLRVTARVDGPVDLVTPGLQRGRPDAAIGPLRAALRIGGDASPTASEPEAAVTAAEREREARRAAEVRDAQSRLLTPPAPDEAVAAARLAAEARREARAEAERPAADAGVLPAAGVVSVDAPRITAEPAAGGGTTLTMQGGVKLQYEDLAAPGGRVVTLRAERAVVFLDGEDAQAPAAGRASLDASGVSGVYLEDAVEVSDGDLAVRGARVFYDVTGNRAVLLDAVLYRVDPGEDAPLYVRAEVLRQTARQSFAAEEATLTTTSFAEPTVAVGADRLDVRGYETRGGRRGLAVDARGLTLEAGGVPVFWFPRVAGRGSTIPLRSVAAGYSENQGVRFRTVWDAYGLLGIDAPPGVDASFTLGVNGEHGGEVGGDLAWQGAGASGFLHGYALPDDNGEDNLPRRPDPENDGVFRGHAGVGHRQALPNATTLTLEAQSSSDPTYYEAFFRNLAYSAPADEAAAYLQHRDGDTSASLLVSARIDPFLGQLVPLETFGYTVDRLPEAQVRQVGRSLAGGGEGRDAAQLLWFQETTAGLLRANADRSEPGERGFVDGLGTAVFGVPAGVGFDEALDARGVPGDAVARLDSRQELQAPVRLGPVTAAPFAVGRITAYDQDFDAFSGGGNDPVRAWGQAGVRLSANAARTLTDAGSGLLDVDGLRHVVEPHATLAYAWTNLSAERLPVYDPLVEDLAEGGQAALGVRQTLQTRRGPRQSDAAGAPAWAGARTVDWVIVDTTLVLQEEARRGTPGLRQLLLGDDSPAAIGRYDDHRPETARGGDFLQADARWLVTDSLGLAGEVIQDLDGGGVPLWRVGGQLQHTPRFALRAGYTRLRPLDSELLSYGFRYRLTAKYAVEVEHTIDLGGSERRVIDVDLERRLPQFSLRVSARFDELRDDTTFGFALVPRRAR